MFLHFSGCQLLAFREIVVYLQCQASEERFSSLDEQPGFCSTHRWAIFIARHQQPIQAVLSKKFALRRNLLTFGDGIWAAVFIALKRQTSEEMKTISLKRESTAMQSVKALAEKALESLTSTTTILVLGVVATFAIMAAVVNETWTSFTTVATIAFVVAMAISMTIDIEKGGDA